MAAMECKVAIVKIHDYLDGELPREEKGALHAHMNNCPDCRARFEQLEKTDAAAFLAMDGAASAVSGYDAEASSELKNRIMASLPKGKAKERNRFIRMIYRYPGITAAAVFLLVMMGSMFATWEQDSKLTVSGEDLQNVVIDGNTVIVPEGVELTGNLTVENGKLEVQGSVEGDVTVIDGSMVLASTGHIAGQSRTIDQALDWFWYKVISTFSGAGATP
ncbi:zf-HC2 domain-containing protein [Paenibacillus sp. LHD-117]|uniref:zf-HC2 domain-containing protein n=1 Tax=Paenibacillus sp. LHD-117 TaxID=3071412 RepID=UPI0027E017FB|nr:zf-HC2 domain-containing protein [Paenibacillus sp. LHD-117]MDQ6420524.1 zf-HC2 domain-containing protein [Paenibacillus sp. LHD-117]